jgi:hypothetical protein
MHEVRSATREKTHTVAETAAALGGDFRMTVTLNDHQGIEIAAAALLMSCVAIGLSVWALMIATRTQDNP